MTDSPARDLPVPRAVLEVAAYALRAHLDWLEEWRAQEEQHYDAGVYEEMILESTDALNAVLGVLEHPL